MDLFTVTFESVAVLLGIGVIGFTVLARKMVPESIISVVTPLAIEVAVPCLVVGNMLAHFDPSKFPNWWAMPLWWAGFMAFMLPLTLLAMRVSRRETRKEFGVSLFYPNAIFVPLALISGMFGRDTPHLAELFLFTLFYPAFFFNTYWFFYRGFRSMPRPGEIAGKLFNPILMATLAALAIQLTGLDRFVPGFVISALKSVGEMSVPLVMIVIGGSIYVDFRGKGALYLAECLKFVFFKNLAFPMIVLAVLVVLRPPYEVALLLVIQSAVPPVTAVPIVAEREGGNRAIANQFIVSSFIASVATLPAVIWLFGRYFSP